MARWIDGSSSKRHFTSFEYWVKELLYDCRHCGDCTLGEMGFLCPRSQCAKFLLNGPLEVAGTVGARYGRKGRSALRRVYERLQSLGKQERLDGPCFFHETGPFTILLMA